MGCFQRLGNCALMLLLVVALLAAAAYFYLLPRLDAELADAVRREFMMPPSSTVEITRGSLLDTAEGEVTRCVVQSNEAKVDELTVSNLYFLAEDLRFDLARTLLSGQAELISVERGELSFKVAAGAIEERWAGELSRMGLSKVSVELGDDRIGIDAVIDLKVTKVAVGATGELYVDGTDRIRFRATELELGSATIGVEKFHAMFSALTPVIDLGQFKLVIVIDDVEMRDGYLSVSARSLSLEEKLRAEKARAEETDPADEEAATESNTQRWKIPSLDELKDIFLEETPEDGAEESKSGDKDAVGEDEQSEDDDVTDNDSEVEQNEGENEGA